MPSVHRSILPLVCPVRKRRPPNRRNPDDDVNENDRSTTPRHRFHVPFQRFSTGKCRKGDRSCGLFTTTPSSRHMFSMFGCDTVIKRNGYPPVRMGHFYTRVVAHMTHDEKRRTPPCVSSLVPHRATRFLYCGVVEQAGWHGFDSVRTRASMHRPSFFLPRTSPRTGTTPLPVPASSTSCSDIVAFALWPFSNPAEQNARSHPL